MGALLLALFVTGGVLAPAAHRLGDALRWDGLRASGPAACDHSKHDARFEIHLTAYDDAACPLCDRYAPHLSRTPEVLRGLVSSVAPPSPPRAAASAAAPALLPIRAPPSPA